MEKKPKTAPGRPAGSEKEHPTSRYLSGNSFKTCVSNFASETIPTTVHEGEILGLNFFFLDLTCEVTSS